MLLDSKNKFETRRFIPHSGEGTPLSISERGFVRWTNGNMYRTSYHDMSNRVTYKRANISLGNPGCEQEFPYSRLPRLRSR